MNDPVGETVPGQMRACTSLFNLGRFHLLILISIKIIKMNIMQDYKRRAYVTEVAILNETESDTGSLHGDSISAETTGVTPDWPSVKVNIADLLNSVNTDRLRFFDKSVI